MEKELFHDRLLGTLRTEIIFLLDNFILPNKIRNTQKHLIETGAKDWHSSLLVAAHNYFYKVFVNKATKQSNNYNLDRTHWN